MTCQAGRRAGRQGLLLLVGPIRLGQSDYEVGSVVCLRVLRVQDNDQLGGRCLDCPGGRSNIQIPKPPPSTRRSRPCSRTSLQLTSKQAASRSTTRLSELPR